MPGLLGDRLDLTLDLRVHGRVVQLTTTTQQTNLECYVQFATRDEIAQSGLVVSYRGGTLTDQVGALCPKQEDMSGEFAKEVIIAEQVDRLVQHLGSAKVRRLGLDALCRQRQSCCDRLKQMLFQA
jgi:hypothetical protein